MSRGKCKLCLRTADLQKSHLMPAALYRKSRTPGASNPNPTLFTERRRIQTSHQVRDFLLCRDCEQLFSQNGESYVMTQVYDGKKFPLLDTLRSCKPTWRGQDSLGYDSEETPSIDRDKLGYFALSVFWRASVHVWREPGEKSTTIDLGSQYNEIFRKYLLGHSDFPENVVLLIIACTDILSNDSFYVPSLGRKGADRTYSFMARGLNFLMIIGKSIDPPIRNLCAVTGPKQFIISRSCETKVLEAFQRLKRLH